MDHIRSRRDALEYLKEHTSPHDSTDAILETLISQFTTHGVQESTARSISNLVKSQSTFQDEESCAVLLLHYAMVHAESSVRPRSIVREDDGTTLPSTNIRQDSWITMTFSNLVPNSVQLGMDQLCIHKN